MRWGSPHSPAQDRPVLLPPHWLPKVLPDKPEVQERGTSKSPLLALCKIFGRSAVLGGVPVCSQPFRKLISRTTRSLSINTLLGKTNKAATYEVHLDSVDCYDFITLTHWREQPMFGLFVRISQTTKVEGNGGNHEPQHCNTALTYSEICICLVILTLSIQLYVLY